MTESEYFPSVDEQGLDGALLAPLGCLREVLATIRPSNVAPDSTLVRSETGGADFLLPNREIPTFAVVVRAGTRVPNAGIAYSSCKQPERGDEFEDAFDDRRARLITRVDYDADDCQQLGRVLGEYLTRPLTLLENIDRRSGAVLRKQILWPNATDNGGSDVRLWSETNWTNWLRPTAERIGTIAFDER